MTKDVDALGGLILEVFRLNGTLIAQGDQKVAPFGLSSARWQVLGGACRSASALTVSQLARETGASRQAVQRIVNTLVADGLVEMSDNPRDRRALLVTVTQAGRQTYAQADGVRRAWLDDVAGKLDAAEVAQTRQLLAKLRDLLSRNS